MQPFIWVSCIASIFFTVWATREVPVDNVLQSTSILTVWFEFHNNRWASILQMKKQLQQVWNMAKATWLLNRVDQLNTERHIHKLCVPGTPLVLGKLGLLIPLESSHRFERKSESVSRSVMSDSLQPHGL